MKVIDGLALRNWGRAPVVQRYRDNKAALHTSAALWIPIAWMILISSRPVTQWSPAKVAVTVTSAQFAEGSPFNVFVFGALIAAAVLVLNFRATRFRSLLRANGPVLLFFAYCLLSLLWSDFSIVASKRLFKAFGEFLILAVVVTDAQPQLAIRRFLLTPAILLLPLSVLLILFFPSLGTYTGLDDARQMVTYYGGVTTNKNTLGVACLVHGLACLWCWLDVYAEGANRRRTLKLIVYGVLYATAVGLIVRADSMTSLVSLSTASLLLIAARQRIFARNSGNLKRLIVGLVLAPLLTIWIDTSGVMAHLLGRQASFSGRTLIWSAVLSIPINPVLGTGFESFWLGKRLDEVWMLAGVGKIQEAHNGYIEVYLNLGWIGLILLAWLLWTGYRSAIVTIHSNTKDSAIRLAFIVASLVYSMTEAGFRMMNPVWIIFLLSVILMPGLHPAKGAGFRSILGVNREGRTQVMK